MLTVSFVLTALLVAVVVGAALSAYLWWIRCRRLEMAGGIAALAAMRWREFSHFVVEALHAQGFEVSQAPPLAERGQQADLALTREGATWLLVCKQGANYRIGPAQIDELANAVQFNGAAGGILATLGRIHPDARKNPRALELLDGQALWTLIDPLLPPSLHDELKRNARATTLRTIAAAWLFALAVGIAAAMVLDAGDETAASPTADPARSAAATTTATAVPDPAGTSPADTVAVAPVRPPLSEDEQRQVVVSSVSTLPGIDRAVWSTRSTLLIHLLNDEAGDLDEVCAILDRFPDLRTSRLQLQAPAGSTRAVRFLQCRSY